MTVLGVLAYAFVAALATWFVFRTFYRTENGTRLFLAAFLLGGLHLMILAAIGGGVTLQATRFTGVPAPDE